MTPRNIAISFVLVLTSIGGVVTYYNATRSTLPNVPAIGVVVETHSATTTAALLTELKGKRVYFALMPDVPTDVRALVEAAPSVASTVYGTQVEKQLVIERLTRFVGEREAKTDFAVIEL